MSDARHDVRFTSPTTAAALFALVAILAGCTQPVEGEGDEDTTGTSASAIVGGRTTSSYAAVGALTEAGSPFCTGTVVARRTVVTAAHCLEGVRLSQVRFAFGPNAFAPQATIRVAQAAIHPGYDRNRITNDIGVLVLAEDAPVTPIPVNTAAMDASWVGRSLTFVGYGVTSGITQRGFGVKREVDIAVAQVGATQFAYADRARNTCSGDSGGPALTTVNGQQVVVGVTSYGDQACRSFGVDTRVDAFAGFLDPYLP